MLSIFDISHTILNLATIMILSYLAGSFPTGVIAGYITQNKDIRKFGSGNTGATNTFRVLGPGPGIVVSVVDFLKGYFAVGVISRLTVFNPLEIPASVLFIICTLSAVIGHVKPVFTGFKGGMGFNTAAGAVTAVFPLLAPFCLLVFFLSLTLTGHVAVCASITSLFLPGFYFLVTKLSSKLIFDPVIFFFFVFVFFLVLFSVRRKLRQYFKGEAVLFERVMIFKRRKSNETKK